MFRTKDYVTVIRFDNKGFNPTPYNSPTFCHTLPFISEEISSLSETDGIIDYQNSIIKPAWNDWNWSGCFAFLEEYNPNNLNDILSHRRHSKKNVALLHKNQLIWVRNVNHQNRPFYVYYNSVHYYEDRRYEFPELISSGTEVYCWVKMSVELALKRLELYKSNNNNVISEIMSECYLTNTQIKQLYYPSITKKLWNFMLKSRMNRR